MQAASTKKIERLIQKGVNIPAPHLVMLGSEVVTDRIAGEGVVIHPGCRIIGRNTLIMAGSRLGSEGPVTLDDCQLGRNVELKGGYFHNSVFLDRVTMGLGAHVRGGCILEEEAGGGHTVGLKQTILFPFVTLGSLINFCDCLMAGGTSRRNHSEVGSSYIHFNFTPNQDKATPSLIGDVPRGVMLNQPPVFLGGQGGLVGPVRIEYGSVIAAGLVWRTDVLEPGRLLLSEDPIHRASNFCPGLYWTVKKLAFNNTNYIANLIALKQWYTLVRSQFFGGDPMEQMLYEGLKEKLTMAIDERISRFAALSRKLPESAEKYQAVAKGRPDNKLLKQKKELSERWHDLENLFQSHAASNGDPSLCGPFLEEIRKAVREMGSDYVHVIQGLDGACTARGTTWLQSIVDRINAEAFALMPSFGLKF